jgi:hypothetical protein
VREVDKYGATVPISDAVLAEAAEVEAAILRYQRATPEQRAEWAREATDRRRREREAFPVGTDLLAGLSRHFGWTLAYIRHLAQPYCECDYDRDGTWYFCPHAGDEGFDGASSQL